MPAIRLALPAHAYPDLNGLDTLLRCGLIKIMYRTCTPMESLKYAPGIAQP